MAENFIEKLMKAKKVKITNNGKTIIVPPGALRSARDLAIEMIAHEEGVNTSAILKNMEKFNKKVESAFRVNLEGYAESVTPVSNPGGRHRARAAVASFEDALTGTNAYFAKAFAGLSEESRYQKSLTIKSGVFKIADIFMEGNMKINRATIESDREPKKSDLGMNWSSGMKKTDVKMVIINRYFYLMAVTLLYTLIESLFKIKKDKIEDDISAWLEGKTIKELMSKETTERFVEIIKRRARAQIAELDLVQTLKSPDL